jgi:DNA-binding NtrC family response regulator
MSEGNLEGTLSFNSVAKKRHERRYRLAFESAQGSPRTMPLAHGIYTLGSAKDADVRIEDPHVSRAHLKLTVSPSGVNVEDLGSSNGTWINGVSIRSVMLTTSTGVTVGRTPLRIEIYEDEEPRNFGDAVGECERMQGVFGHLKKLAPTDLSITLIGETGTGKDVLARAVHASSTRSKAPFVIFDCGAVAPTLIESELFGHVKGAFTGAIAERKGVFEQAHGGTVFLDEIGELPLELQPRLLRALEQRTVRRVGGAKDIAVDVRVIAATNRNLQKEVDAGKFRQDLYFRLNTALVEVPPLRDRLDDIAPMVEAMLREAGKPLAVADSALETLRAHDWPGNVRELKNVITSAAALADGPILEARHFASLHGKRRDQTLERLPLAGRTLDALERAAIKQTLSRLGGNKTQAAAALGIAASTLYEKIKKYGI